MKSSLTFNKKKVFATAVLAVTGIGAILLGNIALTGRFNQNSQASQANTYDVVIAGAGTGGISAAIQAARQGSTVLLIEETDWIGGQMTAAAVPTIDEGNYISDRGIYSEFIKRIRTYYQGKGKSIATCYGATTTSCFEPKIGQMILRQMIAEYPNITLKTRATVSGITQNNGAVSGVVISEYRKSQSAIQTQVLIDATEYGDLLPLANVPYRAGNTTSSKLNNSACIQDITYTAVVRKYPQGTMPANLRMSSPPPGYSETLEKGFELLVAKNGSTSWGTIPWSWAYHNSYRGLPDSNSSENYTSLDFAKITKTVINFANDYPANVKYLSDKSYRKEVNCAAKLKTIQFLYFVQTKLGETDWSVADDEGYDTAYNREENSCPNIPENLKVIERNLPPIPYVRESQRVIGLNTLTASEIKRATDYSGAATRYASSIAIADYPNDLHGCNENTTLETDLETREDLPTINGSHWVPGPFQIPLETLLTNSLKGFILAEKNISQTRLVNGATRLQPSTMHIGQAAGALAGLATKYRISPEKVSTIEVQKLLLQNKSILYPYWDALVNDVNFSAIQLISLRGIAGGYLNGNFGGNDLLRRDEAAVIVTRAFGIPLPGPTQLFNDVPIDYWANTYISALRNNNIVAGCQSNPPLYCPGDQLTNAQLSVILLRTVSSKGYPFSESTPAVPTYSDVPSTHWAYRFIEGLAQNGIIWYCNESKKMFCPDSNISRGVTARVTDSVLWKINNPSFVNTTNKLTLRQPTPQGTAKGGQKMNSRTSFTNTISTSSVNNVTVTPLPTNTQSPRNPSVTTTPTVIPTQTPAGTPALIQNSALSQVYITFGRIKYNKYAAPSILKAGDTLYLKNFDSNKIKLLQVFLYDYEKKGNVEFRKSKVTPLSMFVQTSTFLPIGKRFAYVAKFQDNATGETASKYFVFYTTNVWNGISVE